MRSLIILIVAAFTFSAEAQADEWKVMGWTIDPLIAYSHTSSIIHGCPLNCDKDELILTYYSAGFTFSSPKDRWEVDLTQGWKDYNCIETICSASGSQVQVRWYPFK